MMSGNAALLDHGILNESSDIRAHVCVKAELLYVFETQVVPPMIESGRYHKTNARTGSMVTSEGYLVPVASIPGIRTLAIPKRMLEEVAFDDADSTSEKGRKAQVIVEAYIRKGWFPFIGDVVSVEDVRMQKDGVDLMVNLSARIQVKCDWNGGGPGKRGCTGNVYIEVAECNPYRQY